MTYTCPYCRKKPSAEKPLFPFCSERCKLSDLGHWAREDYRVPGKHIDRDEDDDGNGMASDGAFGGDDDSVADYSSDEKSIEESSHDFLTRHIDFDDDE